LTVFNCKVIIISFAGVERKFFEKGIRRDRKPALQELNASSLKRESEETESLFLFIYRMDRR